MTQLEPSWQRPETDDNLLQNVRNDFEPLIEEGTPSGDCNDDKLSLLTTD